MGKQFHCYLNNTIVVCLKYAFSDCRNIFTPVHRLKEFCRSSQHEFALHVHSLKKECCTWLCAFLPMSCRVQIQGEKLCRIICKFDREANQETDALPTCIQLLLGVFINLVKKQFWRGEFFLFIVHKTFMHILQCH